MKLSAAGLDLLRKSEGFRSQTYMDVNGFPTIGYGHRLLHPESFPGKISEAQAAEILISDVGGVHNRVYVLLRDVAGDRHGQEEQPQRFRQPPPHQGQDGQGAGGQENAGLKARREAEFALWSSAKSDQKAAA